MAKDRDFLFLSFTGSLLDMNAFRRRKLKPLLTSLEIGTGAGLSIHPTVHCLLQYQTGSPDVRHALFAGSVFGYEKRGGIGIRFEFRGRPSEVNPSMPDRLH